MWANYFVFKDILRQAMPKHAHTEMQASLLRARERILGCHGNYSSTIAFVFLLKNVTWYMPNDIECMDNVSIPGI